MSATFISRDWSEVNPEENPQYDSNPMGIKLLNPLRGWKAFHVTFKVMFIEEYRENRYFRDYPTSRAYVRWSSKKC